MVQTTGILQKKEGRFGWFKILVIGVALFFTSLVIMVFTRNPNLFPMVVMIGNFLIPVTYVTFFYERRDFSQLNLPKTALTFFYGGVLGVLGASILEPIFIQPQSFFSIFWVGLIEELVKILGVLLIARRASHDTEMDGLILGAAAGMGFAALESMGYAFSAFIASGGSLSATVGVTLIRGLLAPIGHGTWTAILTSVLFRESAQGRFRITRKVVGAYLTVAFLHSLWDGLPGVAAAVFSSGLDVLIAQSFVAGLGLLILGLRWREARRLQLEREAQEVEEMISLP